jgi:hypothetical protein
MSIRKASVGLAALGAVSLAALGASAMARSAEGREVREARCDMLENDRGTVRTIEALDLHVLRDTAQTGRFLWEPPQGIVSIMCSRNSIIPAAHDDEVIWLGMPFHIAEMGNPGRLGVLEIDSGRYRFRMLEGRIRPEEQPAIDARLAEFQARFPPTS